MAGNWGGALTFDWNEEEADGLRRFALTAESRAAEEYLRAAPGGLIQVGCITVQIADYVALTDAGLARSRVATYCQARSGSPRTELT